MRRRHLPIAPPHEAEDPGGAPSWETLDVRTADGWSLRTDVGEPRAAPVGTAVLAHALMARRSEFDRPRGEGLARFFVERGWRVVTFDFRGHGDSAPPPRASRGPTYDDLVFADLPAIFGFAGAYGVPARPAVLVGHSLGGHVALAAQGAGLVHFDAVVAVASDVWLQELEPSPARWLVKRAALRATRAICARVGRFPSRALRLGSDDETAALMGDFDRFARTGCWLSADGRRDYLASLANVRVPVLQVVSDGDRLQCPPECGARFVARCGGPHDVLRVTGYGGAPPPTHMGLVLDRGRGSPHVGQVWDRVATWMARANHATGAGGTSPAAEANGARAASRSGEKS